MTAETLRALALLAVDSFREQVQFCGDEYGSGCNLSDEFEIDGRRYEVSVTALYDYRAYVMTEFMGDKEWGADVTLTGFRDVMICDTAGDGDDDCTAEANCEKLEAEMERIISK